MKKMVIGNYLTPYLLGICVVLTVVLVLEYYNLVQVQDSSPAEVLPAVERIARAEFTAPGIAAFSEVTDRPLFREGRQPPPEQKKAPKVAAKLSPLRVQLEGVAMTPTEKIAVIRDLSSNKILRLEEGMKHQGWELTSITAGRATFKHGETSHEFKLISDEKAARR